jgi:hypothetical protein
MATTPGATNFTGLTVTPLLNPQGGNTSGTGNVEITQGNLTLDNGNLSVTGNETITGNQQVNGNQSVGGVFGAAGTAGQTNKHLAAADMSGGVTALTVTIPTANASATFLILVRLGYAQASHTYDSTRVAAFLMTVTRVAGAAAAVVVSSVIGATIATVGSGRTMTFTFAAGSVTGTTGVCTCPITLTTTPSTSNDATDADMSIIALNGPGGITVQ